jgi:catechol 2,3-dioxygenase-like lactoylglutathione lyase family enzyme
MKILRLDHVGINFEDLAAAKQFFLDLGLQVQGEMALESQLLDNVVALKNVKTEMVMMQTPGGEATVELAPVSGYPEVCPPIASGVLSLVDDLHLLPHLRHPLTARDPPAAVRRRRGSGSGHPALSLQNPVLHTHRLTHVRPLAA